MIDHLIGPAARRLAALLLAMLAAVACGSATEPRDSLVHPGESVEVRFGSSDTNRVFNIATAGVTDPGYNGRHAAASEMMRLGEQSHI